MISNEFGIEGLTISGGEPLEQMDGIISLINTIRQKTSLSVLIYTGYNEEEVKARPGGNLLLSITDVLISGPYMESKRTEESVITSSNQKIILLSDRYTYTDIMSSYDMEIHIDASGKLIMTGYENIFKER